MSRNALLIYSDSPIPFTGTYYHCVTIALAPPLFCVLGSHAFLVLAECFWGYIHYCVLMLFIAYYH